MKDKKQLCQIAVPAAWTADRIMPSMVTAPDKKTKVIFSNKPEGASFTDIGGMAKQMFKPAKSFEDSGKRLYFASAPANGKSSLYVLLNTKPLCEAQIEFFSPAFEADAKQMVESLKPVK